MTETPAPELPPGVGDAGPRIVNRFGKAVAMYYINSKHIITIGESFQDIRKAIAGLEIRVERHRMGLADGATTGNTGHHSGSNESNATNDG
jgi:hypothetical protein